MYNKKQQGQALLFVLISMTIALAVGINVSLRTISTLARTSNTDTATRVLAAAEGGAEQFVVKSNQTLSGLLSTCNGNYGTNNTAVPDSCAVKFDTNLLNADPVKAQAAVKVETFSSNKPNGYEITVKKDNVGEVNLVGTTTPLTVCWKPIAPAKPTDIYLIFHTTLGAVGAKQGLTSNAVASPYKTTGFTTAGSGGASGYSYCVTTVAVVSPKTLRVYSLHGDSNVLIQSNSLPVQGYKITSFGQLINQGKITATKTVVVYRSNPFLPSVFDAGIYTLNDLN
ncbi:MAG TPA: hypothetical protein VLI92_02495 [Candidatus Saccharimonadales bacterium]|nr:hypothetical protein [Candidatus Saccharimonadales bacterium]